MTSGISAGPKPWMDAAELAETVTRLAAEIDRDHPDGVVLIGVLKGSVFFLVDLVKRLQVPVAIDFFQTSSYGGGTSAGEVRIRKDLDLPVRGADVLLVEDIVDTGMTVNYVVKTLLLREPASLAAVTLLDRPYRRLVEDIPVRYVGFTVPDEFFVGYGFDLDERYRNLPDLRLLSPA